MALAACLATSLAAQGSTLDFETVVLSGQQAPGAASGVVFGFLDAPVINASGQTAFFGGLDGPDVFFDNEVGVYSDVSGTLTQIARQGEQVPGADTGVVFDRFFPNLRLNDVGQIAFLVDVDGPGIDSTNDEFLFNDVSGTLAPLVRTGAQVPGAATGVVFSQFPRGGAGNEFGFNDAGQTVFRVNLSGTGVQFGNARGIYSDVSGVLAPVAREGDQIPGMASGVVFAGLSLDPLINASGQIAFRSNLNRLDTDGFTSTGIFIDVAGELTQIALTGEQAPGADSGVVFDFFSQPVLNDSGQIGFLGFLGGTGVDSVTNDSAIYSGGAATLTQVARAGDQAPGADIGVVFSRFDSDIMLNAAGHTAFTADLTGPGVVGGSNAEGIYTDASGTLTQVVRAGDQAPGAESGVGLGFFNDFVFNAAGQIAFVSSLVGANVDNTNNRGLYATGLDGQLVEIVRDGDLFDVNDDPLVEDLRTISFISFLDEAGSNEDGLGSGFNDLGQVAFAAGFTDGSTGIFVSNLVAVPEPGTLAAMLSVAGLSLLRRRRG